MRFSIIVPAYNAEDTICRCLDSIVSQTYNDFEVLIINDGSTDNTRNIIDYYKNKDSRFKIIHKKNGGVSSARNLGLREAQGDYIIFIDADDYISPSHLNDFASYNDDLIISGFRNFGDKDCVEVTEDKTYNESDSRYLFTTENFNRTLFRVPWGKAYKNSIIIENCLRFKEDLYLGEDTDFVLRFIFYSSRFRSISKSTYNYNYIEDRISHYKLDANTYYNCIYNIENSLNNIALKSNHHNLFFHIEKYFLYGFELSMWNNSVRFAFINSSRWLYKRMWRFYPSQSLLKKMKYSIIVLFWPLIYYKIIQNNLNRNSIK